jgi:hypothetical protein
MALFFLDLFRWRFYPKRAAAHFQFSP